MTRKTDTVAEDMTIFPHDEPLAVQLERHRQYLRRALRALRASEKKLPQYQQARSHPDIAPDLAAFADNLIRLHSERIATATRQRDLAIEMIDRLTARGPAPVKNG